MLGSFPFHGLFISATETEQAEDPVDLQNIFCSAIDLTNDLIDQCYPGKTISLDLIYLRFSNVIMGKKYL